MERLTLPPASWRTRPGLDALATALGAEEGAARYVGGAVRDTLLGLPVADIDIATAHPPQQVITRLASAGIKAIPTGLAHGTITAVSAGTVVEVTTLRRDVATDGRHAQVAFTDDWQEDAARRDFTMNALYADPVSGTLFDWFGGLDDLAARRVRFIGDPYRRIAEDHLRILRFFRFHARFGDTPDSAGLDACTDRANDLMALSRERIAAELLKLLVAKGAVPVVALMVERGIFRPVLPEIVDVPALTALAEAEAAAGVAPDAIRRLAALIPPATAEAVGSRLRLSNADRKRLIAAHDGPGSEGARGLAYRVGREIALDRLLLAGADVEELQDWSPPRLPVGGGDLVTRGIARGPEVARALREIETRWIAEGFPDASRTAQIADMVTGQLLGADSNS
ncbi:poly(A) polymerase [Sphingomonas sp. OV641]|uniref:CCA tRNA nucleotidyltransferase n=1 Tax=Sphingomonas sp. OV641 TaxID=1881068 RepID=UPI0008D1620C|nr:CCA tRNA nucleotidyltransferase [Sphingomonas sp. OV641]SEI93954.1 poly(A) polymerase [Sphingomonas sp. OV641]